MHVSNEPVLECNLEEFWNEFLSKQRLSIGESREDVIEVFSGKAEIKPRFRIRRPDGKGDVFFNSRELLCRFANFPTPAQTHFLDAARAALAAHEVHEMIITVPWSKHGTKKLQIRSREIVSMDIEVLN